MITLTNLIDDAKCYEIVRQFRWPDGICCPKCDSKEITKRGKDETKASCKGFTLTPGNIDDRQPVPKLLQQLFGFVFADKGYVSQKLALAVVRNGRGATDYQTATPYEKSLLSFE